MITNVLPPFFMVHSVEDKCALQLCLYFDECEVVNPLGSRRGIHKIGFIYLSLRNIQPVFNSHLCNIHIVAAFNTLDRSKYGFETFWLRW